MTESLQTYAKISAFTDPLPADVEPLEHLTSNELVPGALPAHLKDIHDMPEKARAIMILRSVHIPYRQIARVMGCNRHTIEHYVGRYGFLFPSMTPQQLTALRATIYEGQAMRALSHITPEKLEASSAAQLTIIASNLEGLAQRSRAMAQDTGDQQDRLSSLELLMKQTATTIPAESDEKAGKEGQDAV